MQHAIYIAYEPKITEAGYRTFARRTLGGLRGPQVRGIEIDKRTAVFVSREDLSAGLVGQPVDGIHGYDPKTATALMANLLLYAAAERKPATAPATTTESPIAP
jgi:hypothetical protein